MPFDPHTPCENWIKLKFLASQSIPSESVGGKNAVLFPSQLPLKVVGSALVACSTSGVKSDFLAEES